MAYWILSGTDPGTTTAYQFPSGIGTWGNGPQFVVAERVFRWRRLHGSLFKYGQKSRLYGGNTKFTDDHRTTFRYEELVDDWVTITTVEAPKRGPLLKSRLTGDAYMYKAVLQNDLLQDPDEGVNYFKNTLKKYFLKGATNVYLYRLLSFFNHRRQNQKSSSFLPQNSKSFL